MDSFFSLPFKPGTRVLTLDTLNKHSDFRKPRMGFWDSSCKRVKFENEILTLQVKLKNEPVEYVYLKVTESALLVSCSVDTDQTYLSRHAYFAVYQLLSTWDEFDFEQYYWPGFFDAATGLSKFVVNSNLYDTVSLHFRVRYHGFYKPGHVLPAITDDEGKPTAAVPTVIESDPENAEAVLGFCLVDMRPRRWATNHWPFLIPYVGYLDKNKSALKGFKSFVMNRDNLFLPDLDDEQQQLLDICFEMKQIAVMDHIPKDSEPHLWILQDQITSDRFTRMFELWREAMPLFVGRMYKNHFYSHGMKNVKGRPRKKDMKPCILSREVPQLCFIWKAYDDYYKLELRFKLGNQVYVPSEWRSPIFFAYTEEIPHTFYLLGSLLDCQLMNFFQKSDYRMLILKTQFEGRIKDLVNQLRGRYQFIPR
ncbi:hypothetical protein SAMN06265348_1177 [Pedobacter westerhofensis]|uniref:Uncharacterized protein n=1 Tax=Pedobacter westerhofensis TaxID=425512 RepID=A0A521FQU1_9SPHI|nr:hypothetical protein [Pedobacter westerhofensis]SMO98552.1 hypothetical protein SAMN06265348_1177 [Pedobacter westerhofensis]